MLTKEDINEVIVENMQIDHEGVKVVKTFGIAEIMELGIEDVASFLAGILDAENDNEFNDSSKDYTKGYSYGKTGKF